MNVIITGATGYVGEGVLLDCLQNPKVEKILSVSRRPTGIKHEKLSEWILPDLMQVDNSEHKLDGYDAVFFCAGITSVGTPEDVYKKISYDIPVHFAEQMPAKEKLTFIYVSGSGTSAKGRQMWQKVKSATELKIQQMGFKGAFGYRPAMMTPLKGQKTKQVKAQRAFSFLLPLGRLLNFANTISEVARSMVNISESGYSKPYIDPKDIRKLAQ